MRITRSEEQINPKQASAYLSGMSANRHLSEEVVRTYAADMEHGDWVDALGDPIRFDESNRLFDGQHRLHAVVRSNTTHTFTVIRGMPLEVCQHIVDTNLRKRTVGDYLAIRQEKYSHELGPLINYLLHYEQTGVVSLRGKRGQTSSSVAMRYLKDHPEIRDYLSLGASITSQLRGGTPRWSALYYIFSQIDKEDADTFMRLIHEPVGLPTGSPILLLRKRFTENLTAKAKLDDKEFSALIIKAWNLWRTGKDVYQLHWRSGGSKPEDFPKPI